MVCSKLRRWGVRSEAAVVSLFRVGCFGRFFVCESLGFLYKTRRLWYTMAENVAANYDAAKLGKLLGAANYDLAALYQKLTENGGGAGRREEGSR